MAEWSFLTNHTRVLVLIASRPGIRLRDICTHTGLTQMTVTTIASDLAKAGYLTKHRVGARNFYEVHPEPPLRGANDGHQIGELLRILLDDRNAERQDTAP